MPITMQISNQRKTKIAKEIIIISYCCGSGPHDRPFNGFVVVWPASHMIQVEFGILVKFFFFLEEQSILVKLS